MTGLCCAASINPQQCHSCVCPQSRSHQGPAAAVAAAVHGDPGQVSDDGSNTVGLPSCYVTSGTGGLQGGHVQQHSSSAAVGVDGRAPCRGEGHDTTRNGGRRRRWLAEEDERLKQVAKTFFGGEVPMRSIGRAHLRDRLSL